MSRRPAFLTSPGAWIRTPRTNQTRVDYACPVQATPPRRRPMADVILAVVLGILAALFLVHALAR